MQEHTELCWLLTSVTAIGELNRMHQFRDKSVAQRQLVSAGLLLYPVLQAADVLAYRAARGAGRGGPARAPRADARHRAPLQRALRRDARGARAPDPDGRRARARPAGAGERKMSTTGGSEQGTVYVLDEPDAIRRKFKRAVTDSGAEVRARRRQARDHEPDRDPRGRARRHARGGRARLRRAPLRRLQDRRRRRGRRVAGAGARALRRAARRRGGARGDPRRPAPSKARAIASAHARATCATRWAWVPRGAPSPRPA